MKEFIEGCASILFVALFGIFAGCMLCTPLKGVGKDEVYNDIKDEEL